MRRLRFYREDFSAAEIAAALAVSAGAVRPDAAAPACLIVTNVV